MVDDAHRRTDLGLLLAWLRQRPDCKLLLATRLHGVDCLVAELTRAGFDAVQIRRLPPLEKLTKTEVRQLATHVLGTGQEQLVERLTRATWDCPLVTVVGGRLLATRAVHPELLERDGDFRQEVLNRFRDETLGRISDYVPPDFGRRLLELTAALGPVPADTGPFHSRIAAFLQVDTVEVTRALGEFERVGLLVRRGQSVRVTPDVVADHILAAACLTPQGASTGFADRVFAEFAGDCLSQLLRNLAELDWRVRVDSGNDSPLLDRVWRRINEGFRAGGHRARAEILERLRDSAFFLPSRVLELIRYAIRNPVPGGPEEVIPGYFSYTHQNVMQAVPELLKRCAYAPDCTPACLDLLWELDGSDDRPPNSNPDHPFRIITDIASYQPDKQLWVNRAALEATRRWLSQPDAWDRRHTPLDVLDSLLEKSGIEHEADGHQLKMRPFHLDYGRIRELREAVLDTLGGCLDSRDLRSVLRSVRSLGVGLHGPTPFFNMTFTAADLRQWEPDQLRILSMFDSLIEGSPPAVVSLSVFREVRHHARYGHLEAVKERASALVRCINRSFDFRLTRMLLPEVSRWDLFEEEVGSDPVSGRLERLEALGRSISAEFWDQFPNPAAAVMEIDRRLRELRHLKLTCDATDLVWWLLETRPEALQPFVRHLLSLPESPVAHCLGVGLVHLHRREPAAAIEIARQALETGACMFRRVVAHHFAWNLRKETHLIDEELALVRRLLSDRDLDVRSTAVGALRRVAAFRPREALHLARALDVSADSRILTELCRLADPRWEGCRDAFSNEDIKAFLEWIVEVDDLNYDVAEFLKFACDREPLGVVEMLIRRIERQEREGYRSGYQPVPFRALHDSFSGLVGEDRHREVLCRVRDYALDKSGLTLHSLASLYRDVSHQYDPTGTEVLADWLLNGNPEQMETAAALLEDAPKLFVFEQLGLVSSALDRAETFGDDCLNTVAGVFYKIAYSGTRSGTSGQPFPQDIALRDRCREVLPRLTAGCAAFRLFRDVLRTAERDIDAAAQEEGD
jgi:hypothetical protein